LILFSPWSTVQYVEAQPSLEGLTFKDALNACTQAISTGDLAAAADLFQSLEATFGSEEEYRDEDVQRRLLPLKGLAELGAERYSQAANSLQSLYDEFPQVVLKQASLLYGLAQAHRGAGNSGQAREILEVYVTQFPNSIEASMAFLERADLFFQEQLIEEGLAALDQFYDSNAPNSLKMQGQLKAIQACLDDGQLDAALTRMLETSWSISTMPELAQLAFSALRCGEYAMSQLNYADALKLFQLVPPKSQLLRLQREKLYDLSHHILSGRQRALLSTNRHQQGYLTTLERQLTGQLHSLEDSEDYTPAFYLHKGQCLLLDGQFHKAWLVFEYIALNENYPKEIREEAHYRWVICAHQMADWEEALTIARNFVARYPESDLAPQTLYLIAKAHLEQRRYLESSKVLTDLITQFPEHPLWGRWVFTRGFNYVVLESYEDARKDFGSYLTRIPEGRLTVNVRLWKALTHFFEKQYAVCIEQLSGLLEIDNRHPMYPEILYRLASAYYSAREYDLALETIDNFLARFERHRRIDESRVLKGDISMGQGALKEAIVTFKQVSKETPDLYLYGIFQVGKILRAQEDYLLMTAHFQSFVDDETSPRIRISEALYWLGWAYQQLEKLDMAFPVFEEALSRYGNDVQAAETQSILQALEKLKNRQSSIPLDQESLLSGALDFKTWLEHEIKRAKETNRETYLSRLILYYNSHFPKDGFETFPLLNLANEISMESMDPEALGKVGLALLDTNDERAETFLTHLVDSFPRSNARAMGFLGLAKLASSQSDFNTAKKWLNVSSDQVPVHSHMNESQLLLGSTLSQLEEFEPAIKTFETVLRQKSARGRPHASALKGIAEAYRSQGITDKAIAYYQRIYNMYRAYPDLVSSAYWASALVFESMDHYPEAVKTLQEMLQQPQLADTPEWKQAEAKLPVLIPLLPEKPEVVNPEQKDESND
jgi:tetratricopeptide (TPR) repeat protein